MQVAIEFDGLTVSAAVRANPHYSEFENMMGRASEPAYLITDFQCLDEDGHECEPEDYEVPSFLICEKLIEAYEASFREPDPCFHYA